MSIRVLILGESEYFSNIFTNKFIRNRKDRDKLETSCQDFYNMLKLNGVFINTNGIIHLSMSHTVVVINKLVKYFNGYRKQI